MRKLFVIVVVLLLALVVSASATSAAKTAKPEDLPVISIYNTPPGLVFDKKPVDRTVAKVYSDGRMAWSKNGIRGGEPFQTGRTNPEQIHKLMSSLDKRGAFTDKALTRAWFGPDAQTTIIEIRDGKKTLRMESWHELFELNPKLIVTARGGVETLGDRSREEVQKAQPEDYKRFRAVWDLVRKTVESWKGSRD